MLRSLNSSFSNIVTTSSRMTIAVSRPPSLTHRPFAGHPVLVKVWERNVVEANNLARASEPRSERMAA